MSNYNMQKKDFERLGIKNIVVLDTPVSIFNREPIAAESTYWRRDSLEDQEWFNDLKYSNGVLIIMETPNDDPKIDFDNAEHVHVRLFKQI